MGDFKDLGNGMFEIKGRTLSLDQLMKLAGSQVKTESELVERAIQQEFSRAKTKHFIAEYTRIIQGSPELMAQVARFNASPEDFREVAELKVKKSKQYRLRQGQLILALSISFKFMSIYRGRKYFESNELVFNGKFILGGNTVKQKNLAELLADVGDKIRLEKNI